MNGLVGDGARLVDGATGTVYSGRALHDRLERVATSLSAAPRGVVFALTRLSLDSVMCYLGAWAAHRPVALLDPLTRPDHLRELVARYQPALVTGVADPAGQQESGPVPEGYRRVEPDGVGPGWQRLAPPEFEPHPDLGVLLATSGSTGDPKMVRLPRRAVLENASAIADALDIRPDDVAPTCLPLFYSYGMSVLNSHLVVGATVLIADGGLVSRSFWDQVAEHRATSLSGVPHSYRLLDGMRWDPAAHPHIKVLTQAGGRLEPRLVTAFDRRMRAVGGRVYVMWGQTEASPRMAVLDAGLTRDKPGSVGTALKGGRILVETPGGGQPAGPQAPGKVIYRGPNVMWGYARGAFDLSAGDTLGGVLDTGDLGYLDGDGCLWLTGRAGRIGKVFGVRINLDDVERVLSPIGEFAVVAAGDGVTVFGAGIDAAADDRARKVLGEELRLHPSGYSIEPVDTLPRLASGKVDYRALELGTSA